MADDVSSSFYARMAADHRGAARANALTDIDRAGWILLAMSVISAALAGFKVLVGAIDWTGLLDPALLAAAAISIRLHHSRFVALALLLAALGNLAAYAVQLFATGPTGAGGAGLGVVFAAGLGVRGTIRLASIDRCRVRWVGVALNLLAAAVYLLLFEAVTVIACGWLVPGADSDPHARSVLGLNFIVTAFAVAALVGLQRLPFTRRATNLYSPEEPGVAA